MEVLSCSKSQVSNNRLERDEAENDSFVKEMPPCSQSQISDDFIEFSSQSTIRSTHSSHEEWQPETSDLDKINNVIHLISNGNCSPLRSQLTTSFKEASVRTQRYYIQISKDIVLHLFEMIAPSQSHILIKELFSREFLWNNDDERVLKIFVKAYEDASDSPAHQKELLSLFSHQYPKELLLQSIPGMTKWRIDTARQHANTSSKNTEVTQKSAFSRLPFDKVEHFVDFLSQPHYIQDIAYGERTIKLSTGQSIHIPDVVRTLIGSRIITCYLSYCKDTEFSPCSRSTLYSLLNRCAASQRKSLSGLDNTTADGISSFEKLVSVTESMESYGLQPTKSEDIMNRLRASKHYLSCDNRWHIQRSTSIPDHCIDYSLSDHRHPELSSQCSHDHNDVCNFCTDQLTVLDDLEQIIIDGFFPTSDIKGEFIHDFQKCKEKIIQWKQHVLRNVCQEEAKQNILQTLERHEVLITMDWAMKYLPWIDREKQTDFFGKKGINWHISVAISKEKDHLKKDCFVHLLDSAPQTWFSVASILEHLLFTVKDQNESLKCAYLKSDNARCYHCGPLISAIPDISRRTGIKVCRYDFSEAQSGKDICDRRIAPLKIHMKRYGNEGHNITTGEEMKEALESYGGVKDTHVYLAEVDFDQQTMQKCPIPFINNFNNFCYEEDGLRMWQAYNVGEGKFISTGELNRKMIGKQDDTG
ncbi:uncharacterized protein LOC134233147 [Saccostrea cucullata]|uniref:uncharacterized protein LOC134233147 n=1 Tax=Saccostrea cuccullata TaxID=36930 RepID=UPI002ED4F14B